MKKSVNLFIVLSLFLSSCADVGGGMFATRRCGFNYENFVDNGNGTVTDTETGLTWKRCPEGGTYSNGRCMYEKDNEGKDKSIEMTRAEAFIFADKHSYAGYSDWRLPSEKELEKILLGCPSELYKGSDGFNPRSWGGWGDQYHSMHATTYQTYSDQCYGQQGVYYGAPTPGDNFLHMSHGGSVKKSVLLVRSDTPSEEFNKNKEIILKHYYSKERQQACEGQKDSYRRGKEAFEWMMGKVASYVGKGSSSTSRSSGKKMYECSVKCVGHGFSALTARSLNTKVKVSAQSDIQAQIKVENENKNLCDGSSDHGVATERMDVFCAEKIY